MDKSQSRGKIKDTLPKEFNWEYQPARREKTKRRAIEGIITGVRKYIEETPTPLEEEGIMERKLIIGKEVWRIITIYSREIENTRKNLEKTISETDSSKVIIGENSTDYGGEEEDGRRSRSKDKVKNEEGKKWWKRTDGVY